MSQTTAPEPPLPHGLLEGYSSGGDVFDEAVSGAGELHSQYARFFQALAEIDPTELNHRWELSRRLLQEQGVTYNAYDEHGNSREKPWLLDPIPMLISPREWSLLEAALIQRATLLDKILADCYGDQELIRSRSLPPALVFSQPDYLRPCRGVTPPNNTHLHFYAADLARSPEGRWWIVSDRTQIPTGAGYALANRVVGSRVLPEAFRHCNARRLAGFFREVQLALTRLAPCETDNPRIVILTPGPYSETYFEQGYLARYLGYMMVEGQDLTVRDDRVYLKTLGGLEPVHVILRRVDDDFCDPLELRNDSILGVPGLLEAMRAGNVAVANTLGVGLLQSPAIMAFLPGLCKRLLHEELKLPSIATWWCGQESARKHVIEHLDSLRVIPAMRWDFRYEPIRMDATQREALKRRIEFQPHLFAAQENIELSTAPSLGPDGLVPRPVTLRVYLIARDGTYLAMPGGLTRVGGANGWHSVSMQQGGASKDTWVLSDQPVEEMSLLHSIGKPVELRRVGNNLPSRLADNFFWLGRYAERADATARLLRAALSRVNGGMSGGALPPLTPILQTLKIKDHADMDVTELETSLLAGIFDSGQPVSLRGTAENLKRLAVFLRERTSNDLWQVLSTMAERLAMPTSALGSAGDALSVVNQTLLTLAAFHGLARENMTRAQGWRFLDMGQRIERSIYLCALLDNALALPSADNPSVLEAVLEVADSSITYRGRYNLLPNLAAVYDLVLLDDTNPRSLLFQLNQLVKHFERLPGERELALPSPGQRILLECVTSLRLLDPRPLNRLEGGWHETEVGAVVRQILDAMPGLSDAIAAAYFAHSAISSTGGQSEP